MNRSELIARMASRLSRKPETIEEVLDELADTVAMCVERGENVNIRRFGKFEARPKKPVVRLNPKTGEEIHVPAKMGIGFVASQLFKDRINRVGEEPAA